MGRTACAEEFSATVPSGVEPSVKETAPVGAGAPAGAATVAVKATAVPGGDGLRLDVSVTAADALIVRNSGWDVAPV